jgi:effector-binding domain-containing protein
MAKLKNIIKQLSDKDYQAVYDSLLAGNAEKSAYLLKAMRERQLSENKVMVELEVNANAYYTMRSRLSQKIEEHLIQQMESPRTDLLRKVANINEVFFTNKKTIAIATLRKLEKELIEADLVHELPTIYKLLKKLHLHSPEYFQFSQLYNRHVAYMLAVDKAEDVVADYFKKYGNYFLTADLTEKMSLDLLVREIQSIANLYESHRLYVYKSCMMVFHRLFVESEESTQPDEESIEDVFGRVQEIFDRYNLDPVYYHLNLLFEFLKLEYYNHYKVFKQAERYYEEVNDAASNLLVNYPYYTFSIRFLISKLERGLRTGTEGELFAEQKEMFADFEPDPNNVPQHVIYTVYGALCSYYSGRYEEAAKALNNLINEVSLKRYPLAQTEVKALLCLQYCMLKDIDLFNQLSNSVQRNIRIIGKDACENVLTFLKILKIAVSEAKKEKHKKISALIPRFKSLSVSYFAPTSFIRMDEKFVERLIALEIQGGEYTEDEEGA